jgi:hypothetical protein
MIRKNQKNEDQIKNIIHHKLGLKGEIENNKTFI